MHKASFRLMTALAAVAFVAATSSRAHSQSVTAVAAEIGLTPESLVIAGIDSSGAGAATILWRIEAHEALRESLANQHQLASESAAQVTVLSLAVLEQSGDATVIEQYEGAISALEAARIEIAILRSQLFDLALHDSPPEQIQKLVVWRSGAAYRVSPEFRVQERPPEQWKAIERALRAERRALRRGTDLDEVQAQLLGEVRSDPAVGQALYNLAANLEAMQQLFVQP